MMEISKVSKSYGVVKAVTETSMRIENASTVCVLGRNGCGKSTLLKIIALITTPDSGSVILDGTDLTRVDAHLLEETRNRFIGYSFQEPLLVPYLTALENVLLVTLAVNEAKEMLGRLGLSHRLDHIPAKLSVGEKKRVDLCRALLRKTPILVADEPLSSLDLASAELVVSILQEFREKGGSIVFSAVDPAHAKWADMAINFPS